MSIPQQNIRIPLTCAKKLIIWRLALGNPRLLTIAHIVAKVVALPVTSVNTLCDKCGMFYQDQLNHALLKCQAYKEHRQAFINAIRAISDNASLHLDNISAMLQADLCNLCVEVSFKIHQ
ncbi:unnamed protein product [Owenia fusiformis]|uniref:Uncharacterized protein n=1 Tax=Owenia fusiformis TaxID=6347 RepID=A0A8J1XKP7_OWEFU|nr:unnamed protein product [Owenia fusiformis]